MDITTMRAELAALEQGHTDAVSYSDDILQKHADGLLTREDAVREITEAHVACCAPDSRRYHLHYVLR